MERLCDRSNHLCGRLVLVVRLIKIVSTLSAPELRLKLKQSDIKVLLRVANFHLELGSQEDCSEERENSLKPRSEHKSVLDIRHCVAHVASRSRRKGHNVRLKVRQEAQKKCKKEFQTDNLARDVFSKEHVCFLHVS